MIVNINDSNFQEYSDIFTEAFKELKKKGYINENTEKTSFSSLAEYYSHMADLFAISAYRYVLLPLDEDAFTINLNDRSITVPASFSKCAGVQNDQLAETITFVVDRYFDYMDLNNTQIYVQWITPDGTHGATHVEMRDLESEADKIRFAWPLNSAITSKPGNVRFSVRFIRVDGTNTVYSLNTLDKEIVIRPALSTKTPTIETAPIQNDEFEKAIINSVFDGQGVPAPTTPSFRSPGADITINPQNDPDLVSDDSRFVDNKKVISLKNDTITLYAQAVAPNGESFDYEWYFIPEGSTEAILCNPKPKMENGKEVAQPQFGTVEIDKKLEANVEFEDGKIPSRNFPERYFDEAGEEYIGPFPTEAKLFTKFSTYTVAPASEGKDINGTYFARAYNTISRGDDKDPIVSINYGQTSQCLIPGPRDVKISKNLESGKIVKNATENLTIELEEDNYGPTVDYKWERSYDNFATKEALNTINSASLAIDTSNAASVPAWYKVNPVASLNRKTKDQTFSTVCKVTLPPEPPIVPSIGDQTKYLSNGDAVLTVTAAVNRPANMANRSEELFSEGLTYVWQMKPIDMIDNKWDTVPEVDATDEEALKAASYIGQGTSTLTVKNIGKYGGVMFRCLVINTLNGQSSVFDHSGSYTYSKDDEYLGEFKPEAPHRYPTPGKDQEKQNYTYTVLL